jgi:hypothetical protein
MDGAGDLVADLQSPPGPPVDAYSALVSNFHPTENIFQRAIDVGVDGFFGTANDLVVPSEGGWRIDRDGGTYISSARIGCYGPGGNIPLGNDRAVHHLNFFHQQETADFLVRALSGERQGLAPLDPNLPLPDRRFGRSTRSAIGAGAATDTAPATAGAPSAASVGPPGARGTTGEDVDTFHIIVMDDFTPDVQMKTRVHARRKPRSSRFARVLATYGGARVTTPMRLRAEGKETKTFFSNIIDTHDRISAYTNREEGSLPSDEEMMEFGRQLFDTLFQGDVRRLYDEARSRQRGRKLDLVLTSMIPWIADKPWEFVYDKGRRTFLATEEIHFIRNVLTNVPADPIVKVDGPLRILVASAQPVGFGQLSIEQETEVVRRGFEPLREAGLVEIEVLPRATPAALHGHLSTGQFTVVHFIGHGVFENGEGRLVFEDSRGGAFSLGERSVREIFCQRGLSLVFLNACQSGTGGRADFNKGVAQSLVAHGLPALVANQYSVLDSSATSFAQHFYWSLAQGMSLGSAAREARVAVNYSLQGELIDWAVPVVYARDPNATLVRNPVSVSKVPTTSVRRSSRRAIVGHDARIAVWDIDDVFPSMDRTLERMNAAQSVYGFELVDMSVPLDVWDLESKPGTPYLWAEKLARRLRSKTVELRVDLLACVTRHWMRDDDTLNLFGWWPDAKAQPVVIFSCAGIDLPAEGPDTDRAIANAMVSALAGYFGDLDSHLRGAKDCPLYFNRERDVRYIAGVLKFDAGCRKRVRTKLGKELPALESLLSVFK